MLGVVDVVVAVEALGGSAGPDGEGDCCAELGGTDTGSSFAAVLDSMLATSFI